MRDLGLYAFGRWLGCTRQHSAYMVRVEDTPSGVRVAWLVAAILIGMEEMVVQVAEEDIEKMVETINVDDTTLKVEVEGRIPRCYKCGLGGHIRAGCPPPPAKDKKDRKKARKGLVLHRL